jgi:hypothetical protein
VQLATSPTCPLTPPPAPLHRALDDRQVDEVGSTPTIPRHRRRHEEIATVAAKIVSKVGKHGTGVLRG